MNIVKELTQIANELDSQVLSTKNPKLQEKFQRQADRVTQVAIRIAQLNQNFFEDEDGLIPGLEQGHEDKGDNWDGSFNPDETGFDHEAHEDDPNFNPAAYDQVMQEMGDDDPVNYLVNMGYSIKDLKHLPADRIEELAQKEGFGEGDNDDFGFLEPQKPFQPNEPSVNVHPF